MRPERSTRCRFPVACAGRPRSINDRGRLDRSQFLLDLIRRSYNRPLLIKNAQRDATLQRLAAQLDRPQGSVAGPVETVPLPLPASVWTDVVFAGRERPETLASAIVRSRGPALLYYGLFSLDDATRSWLAGERQLIGDLVMHSAAFLVAAPGLRVRDGAVRLPGGAAAEPAWEALVGKRANEPAAFVRSLVTQQEGRFGFFLTAMSQLTPDRLRTVIPLDSPNPQDRVSALRRLHGAFERATAGWRPDDRVFWRPALDPALLIADLPAGPQGAPPLPGGRRFWAALIGGDRDESKPKPDALRAAFAGGEVVDPLWLCEQVFSGDRAGDRRRYHAVMFASRLDPSITAETAGIAFDVIRGLSTHPALIGTLERAKLVDVRPLSDALRRAVALSDIADDARAARALSQFQGALAVVTRTAIRGGLQPRQLGAAVSSLSAIDFSAQQEYEGKLVRWLARWAESQMQVLGVAPDLGANMAGRFEHDLIYIMSAPSAFEPRVLEWEGTRYRLDFARAEAIRVIRLIGDQPRPFLTSAKEAVAIADRLTAKSFTTEGVRQELDNLEAIGKALGWDRTDGGPRSDLQRHHRDAADALKRAAESGDLRAASRVAPPLLSLADDLLARGLMELVYAVGLGQPDRSAVPADEAARRHDFALDLPETRSSAWAYATAGVAPPRGWHVTGSVLGLDVRLADFAVQRISLRPLTGRPMLDDDQRRVLLETIVLIEAATLTEPDRETLIAAMNAGRARLAAVRTAQDVDAVADEIRLSPFRRTLLAWTVAANDRDRVHASLSPIELLWLGRASLGQSLNAWGVPAEPRLGCHCLRLLDRQPLDFLGGPLALGHVRHGLP